ncbi:MAG: metallophosphoesterase [Clostridia bacterium]|nr:metallophosphoesterase [Clostridia bacterium]
MKIYAISDFHLSFGANKPMDVFGGNWEGYLPKIETNVKNKVGDNDILLIAGDISWAMKLDDTKQDMEFLGKLPGTKIMIKGNHDYWWQSVSRVREVLPESVKVLQNDAIKIGKIVFCGTRGWAVPDEKTKDYTADDLKIFKRECERLKLTLMAAKTLKEEGDEIIAMIHYPPFTSDHQGTEFTKLFEEYGVSSVVFGHIHGKTNCPKISEINGIKYYFTSCDQINNDPVLICEV